MADFEEDPAAAFLAQEQDELAGIVEDTLGFTSEPNLVEPPPADEQVPQEPDFFSTEPEAAQEITSQDPYSAITYMDTASAEPECIKQWREQQQRMLTEKDAEESTALEDLKNQAKTELEEWCNRQEEQVNQAKGLNRQAEAVFIEERDEDVPGHEWERVARLCDFSSKTSKNTKDVSRMRSIFLQLKQTPLVRD